MNFDELVSGKSVPWLVNRFVFVVLMFQSSEDRILNTAICLMVVSERIKM